MKEICFTLIIGAILFGCGQLENDADDVHKIADSIREEIKNVANQGMVLYAEQLVLLAKGLNTKEDIIRASGSDRTQKIENFRKLGSLLNRYNTLLKGKITKSQYDKLCSIRERAGYANIFNETIK